jgi:hypothetical protein
MTLDECAKPYGDKLIALAESGAPVAETLKRVDEVRRDFNLNVAGDTNAKELALLNAFRDRYAPRTSIASSIINRLVGLDEGDA